MQDTGAILELLKHFIHTRQESCVPTLYHVIHMHAVFGTVRTCRAVLGIYTASER